MERPIFLTSLIFLFMTASGIVSGQGVQKSAELKRLEPLIGKWITIGETVGDSSSKAMAIRASDIYEWATGGFFVIHHAYGIIGNTEGGGVEIIGYDPHEKIYKTYFFDNKGNFNIGKLTCNSEAFFWESQKARCFGEFKRDGKILLAHHQKLNEEGKWVPCMEVTLSKVE